MGGGDAQFGTKSCPIELEEKEEGEENRWAPSHLVVASAVDLEKNMETKLESVPYEHSPSHGSHATAPNSPSIRDSAGNLRLIKSTQVSPEEIGKQDPGNAFDHDLVCSEASRSSDSTKRARKDDGASAITDQISSANADSLSAKKTELEREMELYEAAQMEEKAQFLNRSKCLKSASLESTQMVWKVGPGDGAVKQHQGRKRGRKLASNDEVLSKGEDVCFACLDGGDLILCDKRSCPKAYHMECTGRVSEFFDQKGQWFCGWHVCANCSKAATWHCYTCPTGYCNGCVNETGFHCLRKVEGLCENCYPIVYMLENNLSIDLEGVEVDFDDEETYECYFREYWKGMRQKLPLTLQEMEKAFKAHGSNTSLGEENHEASSESDLKRCRRRSRRMKRRKGTTTVVFDELSSSEYDDDDDNNIQDARDLGDHEVVHKPKRVKQREFTFNGWASSKLINFLHLVNENSEKPLTMRALKRILLNYIDTNKLINPQRPSHVCCDEKLQSLFGKKHFSRPQMIELLCAHIAKRPDLMLADEEEDMELVSEEEKPQKHEKSRKTELDIDEVSRKKELIIDEESRKKELDVEEERPRKEQKSRKKTGKVMEFDNRADTLQQKSENKVGHGMELDNRAHNVQKQPQSRMKIDESSSCQAVASAYAAIDLNNIGLLYLKRPLLEDLRHDPDFVSKVMKAFVRLRIINPSSVKNNDPCYRLVPIVGVKQVLVTCNNMEQTNVILEVLNVQRREEIGLGMVSSRDFTEDECRRLRLCVKSGYLKPMTVGELRDKAKVFQEAKVKHYFETELLRLTHLRDRASEKGRKKELRVCVEKIQLLNSSVERERQLKAPVHITADPTLCPTYVSDNEESTMRENAGFDQVPWESKSTTGKPHNRCMTEAAIPEKSSGVRASDSKHYVGECQQGLGCTLDEDVYYQAGGRGYGDSNSRGLDHMTHVCAKDADAVVGIGIGDPVKGGGWDGDADGHTMDDGWGDVVGDSKKDDNLGRAQRVKDGWGDMMCDESDDIAGTLKANGGWRFHNVGVKKEPSDYKTMKVHQQDDGWGQRAGDNGGVKNRDIRQEDDGWGDCAGRHSQEDGWGHRKNTHQKRDDGWGQFAGHHIQDDGCGDKKNSRQRGDGSGHSAGHHSQDDGFGNRKNTHQKGDGWGQSTGHHSQADGWGHGVKGNTKDDGWGLGNSGGSHMKNERWGGGVKAHRNSTGSHSKNDVWGNGVGCNGQAGWLPVSCKRTGLPPHSTRDHNERDIGVARSGMETSRDWDCARAPIFDRGTESSRADELWPLGDGRDTGLTRTPMNDGQPDVGRAADGEREKVWYYHDLRKNLQGPFSMDQLRRWEKTNLFPSDLRIWRAMESPDVSILLTDALVGRFQNDLPPGFVPNQRGMSPLRPGDRDEMRHGGAWLGSRWGRDEREARPPKPDEHKAAGHVGGGWLDRPWSPHESDEVRHGGGRPGRRWDERGGRPPKLDEHKAGHVDSGRSGMPWSPHERGPGRAVPPNDHNHSHKYGGDDGPLSKRKKDLPCKYFARGICRKGEECDFRH